MMTVLAEVDVPVIYCELPERCNSRTSGLSFHFLSVTCGALEHVLKGPGLWHREVSKLERGGGEGIEVRVCDRARTSWRALQGWPRLVRRRKPDCS